MAEKTQNSTLMCELCGGTGVIRAHSTVFDDPVAESTCPDCGPARAPAQLTLAPGQDRKWKVGAAFSVGNGKREKAEVSCEGSEDDAKTALWDLLESMGVETWIEEVE